MRAGLPVSVVAHLAVIAWGVLSLPMASPIDASSVEMIPVDFIEIDDVTQLTKGLQTAALVEEVPPPPPPAVEPPPLPRPAPPPPPPPPEPDPPAPPPQPEPPPLPTPQPEAPPPPAPSPEAVAPPPPEPAVAQPLTNVPMPRIRPEPPREQARATPQPQPRPEPTPEQPQEQFDVDKLTAMLDQPATEPAAPTPQPQEMQPTLGSPDATASVRMTANELDALRARLAQCWNPPIGWVDPAEVRVVLILSLNADGSVNGQPQIVEAPQGQFARQAPESALRAVRRCAPYILPPEKYDAWREVKVTFDPQDMGRI